MADSSPGMVISVLTDMTNLIEGKLRDAKKAMEEGCSAEELTNDWGKMMPLFGLTWTYAGQFHRLGITKREELEEIVKQNHKDIKIQELFQNLLSAEASWDDFFTSVFKETTSVEQTLQVGDVIPLSAPLQDVRSKQKVTLGDYCGSKSLALVLIRNFA